MIKTPKTVKKEVKSLSIGKSKTTGKVIAKRKVSFDSFSKPLIHKVQKDEFMELDSIGEEGIPQMVRSPIAKREGGSDAFLKTARNLRDIIRIRDNEEVERLRKENDNLRSQLYQSKNLIKDMKGKLENLQKAYEKIEKVNIEVLGKNTCLNEELEKLRKKSRMTTKNKGFLQEELEAKILNLFKEKEEIFNSFQATLIKLNQYLCEFASCEEWVLSLLSSPFMKKEIEESEDFVRSRIEKIKAEIIFCQSQLKTERFVDKSYFTSISSSIIQSPIPSPNLR